MTEPRREAPKASEPVRPPARRWPGRVAAILSVGLFGGAGLMLADWVRDRGRVSERLEHGTSVEAPRRAPAAEPKEREPDPRMATWLDGGVTYGPSRRVGFGRDRAWFTVGTSREAPDVVFARRMTAWAMAIDATAFEGMVKAGPSAAVALRLSASVAVIPGGAALVRLPPDASASLRGALRTEPGGVILASSRRGRWEYLTFWFPEGLDLDALLREAKSSKTAPRVLEAIGPEALAAFEPALSLSGEGAEGGPATVLCRARGPAGAAIERVASGLSGRGWRDAEQGVKDRDSGTRVLTGPDATVWMATADPSQVGGLVTVLIGPP